MKKKIFIAAILAAACGALLYLSVSAKKKTTDSTSLTITGKWKIENIADSSVNKKNELALALISSTGSLPGFLEFNTDSSYSVSANDSITSKGLYYTDSLLQKIFIKQDSVFDAYNIKLLTDSSAIIEDAKDSLQFTLKK